MILKICVAVIFMQFAVCNRRNNCARASTSAIEARYDLLQALKTVLLNTDPKPTKEERMAAATFVLFLNSSKSDDYIEAFYRSDTSNDAKSLALFLNGILFNGDPDRDEWKAVQVLAKMIKTKVSLDKIKSMEQKQKDGKRKVSRVIRSAESTALLKYPKLFRGNTDDFYKKIYNNEYIYRNGFLLPLRLTVKELYKDLVLRNDLHDTKCSNFLTVPNIFLNCRLLNQQTGRVVKLFPIVQALRLFRRNPSKHLMYKDKETSAFSSHQANYKPYVTTILKYK
ncbi:hypothetical protein ILUMI_00371 [Ignelater luminosus]|uniref:Uncharacterized protein n=1 Tax=Ignelater luminosus TaxID=2038154 RepID=A0A8K0GQA6_IGNLU|nr:hypothetical protein ILUMI_00371 [Ignelater luminosus]